ncbi:hypothetical protein B0H63DRAFT_507302 [Podospora didyma]|uniref:Phytocyanin domain-containing protein n=1 Tax=Podospora didyma TaxID=330526 RepID=A0AAE0NY75_9PEZI|nr:hypothetical protein B0H63DRAFT_507302 [Podospora didyma]
MRFSKASLLPLSLLASLVAGVDHVVTVGKGGQLKFDPESITAAAGDTVTYNFFARNHSVTQSSFDKPCQPLEGGFFSGFTPSVSPDTASPTTFRIIITDATKAIWAYCGQVNGNHCQKGMVHSINAPTSGTNTFQKFAELAAAAQTPSTSPADPSPVGGERKLSVVVGFNGTLTFSPNNITELPGTTVSFTFNPKKHTVTESTFDQPCQPKDQGFSSGFIPVASAPSNITFDIKIPDKKPIWFYCGQTTGNHCQSGMVGSINAPVDGAKTLQAYIDLAKNAPPSTIPAKAPLGGTVTQNGMIIGDFGGNTLPDATAAPPAASPNASVPLPQPGGQVDPYYAGMAGGNQPGNYNWGNPTISDTAVSLLLLTQLIEDILLHHIFDGHAKLTNGSWTGVYPKSIVRTLGSMGAQTLVHRKTATDCLAHYQKPIGGSCSLNLQTTSIDDYLGHALKLSLISIGLTIDTIVEVAASDSWLVPVLATGIGAKTRMTAVINMMQNHLAAAAPREALLPAQLAWSYATAHYVGSCPDTNKIAGMPDKPYPTLTVPTPNLKHNGTVTLQYDSSVAAGDKWVAWIGSWGDLKFTKLNEADKTASVPAELYGNVWVVVVSKQDVKLKELPGVTVAGPEMVWIAADN